MHITIKVHNSLTSTSLRKASIAHVNTIVELYIMQWPGIWITNVVNRDAPDAKSTCTHSKKVQPHFRLSELHQCDRGMLLNRFC